MASQNSFNTHSSLTVGGRRFQYYSLPALEKAGRGGVARLPYSLKILLENLLRREDGRFVERDDIQTLAGWDVTSKAAREIAPPHFRLPTIQQPLSDRSNVQRRPSVVAITNDPLSTRID